MVAAGCGPGPGEDGGSSPGESSAVGTSGTDDPTTELPTEDPGPSPSEETDGAEAPVEGESGVSLEIAGLPVGSGQTVDLGGAWCGIFFWGGSLPTGVDLEITEVVVGETGGAVLAEPCEGSPPCAGTTISVDSPEQGCAVVVTPPAPAAPSVEVRLDGTLHCPDQATCDSLNVGAGSTAVLANPGGGEGENTDGTEGGGEGTDGSGGDPGTDSSPTTEAPGSG
ncbi:MAG: hypothetical protein H0U62_13225 [Actinobacteria bacterium]|nr:hypothetical protein [Actinomycetota bacterium]